MPELPEVETTRRGLEPFLVGRRIEALEIRDHRLRWPIAAGLDRQLAGREIDALERRGKYLLIRVDTGALLVHLGMSGSLRFMAETAAPGKQIGLDYSHYQFVIYD